MTSSLPGVKYGAANYKYLEQDKTNALNISKGCFDHSVHPPPFCWVGGGRGGGAVELTTKFQKGEA